MLTSHLAIDWRYMNNQMRMTDCSSVIYSIDDRNAMRDSIFWLPKVCTDVNFCVWIANLDFLFMMMRTFEIELFDFQLQLYVQRKKI